MSPEKWEAVARILKEEDVSDKEVAARTGVYTEGVARVRRDLGLAPFVPLHMRPKVWDRLAFEEMTVPLRGGHRRWKGRHTPNGVPMADRSTTAYRLSFRLHHEREPVGRLQGACRMARCVAGVHLEDDLLRAERATIFKGMDMVAIRRCLRRPGPWPVLKRDEARFALQFSDPGMPAVEVARRLGVCARTVERYRKKAAAP
ncbi:hypothetical protein ABTX34_16855 [Streptomyces sp. NPDC096538]|uniref:hypothetical protein n=1 Tax=Streptomyces sp. NPDC096538 TaxID=3155427 RepID=UPI0033175067